jgi:hypothetical protein
MAMVFGQANPGTQVYYVPTATYEALHPWHDDNGTILTDSGRRVRMAETGTIHLGHVPPHPEPEDDLFAPLTMREASRLRDMLAKGYSESRELCHATTRMARDPITRTIPHGINMMLIRQARMRVELTQLRWQLRYHITNLAAI